MTERRTPSRQLSRLALAGLATLFASCVTQDNYDKATSLYQAAQDEVHRLEMLNGELMTENNRLREATDAAYARGLTDAGYSEEAEAKIKDLQARIAELDRPLEDIETFRVEGGYVTMIQDSLLFASGSAELGAEGKKALSTIAASIQSQPYAKIYVRGHTDSDPIKKAATLKRFPMGNMQLSAERAVAVAHLLDQQKGISSKDLVVMGFGQHMPLKPNDSAANKKVNRRVEIFVADR